MELRVCWSQLCHNIWACKLFKGRKTLQKRAKILSQDLLSTYEQDKISWKEFDSWMEELWIAADNQDCKVTPFRISTIS
jgi:hypothetical protein